jgi:hypothetical protein
MVAICAAVLIGAGALVVLVCAGVLTVFIPCAARRRAA